MGYTNTQSCPLNICISVKILPGQIFIHTFVINLDSSVRPVGEFISELLCILFSSFKFTG
jgi:hypothetical protein